MVHPPILRLHFISSTSEYTSYPQTMNKRQTQPQNHHIFDPWNSSATGHQRADGPSLSHTTAWRGTRTEKLARQFAFGDCRVDNKGSGTGEWSWIRDEDGNADTAANANAGAGAQHGCQDIRDFMAVTKKRKISSDDRGVHTVPRIPASTSTSTSTAASEPVPVPKPAHEPVQPAQQQKHTGQILAGTTIYINGSTMPLISDHKLKHLLVANGAKLSLALARKSVTHVILGRPAGLAGTGTGTSAGKGAGGGLAATKLQKEIDKCGRGNIKVVGVEWYVFSM